MQVRACRGSEGQYTGEGLGGRSEGGCLHWSARIMQKRDLSTRLAPS